MKKLMLTFAVALACVGSVTAKNVKPSFTVNGACGSCTDRIEAAAKSVKGVSAAKWDLKTQKLALTYDNSKTSVEAVQKAIANVGHDAGNCHASDKAYNALPSCCKYRPSKGEACGSEACQNHHAAKAAKTCNTKARGNCPDSQKACHATKQKAAKK